MSKFKIGDILSGTERNFSAAYHPIVYIDGPDTAPLAIVLTHSKDYSCNFELTGKYDDKADYFIAHLIEKMTEWGPYTKQDKSLNQQDIKLIKEHILGQEPITWSEYKSYGRNNCPIHR
jgi:hypothetical protein